MFKTLRGKSWTNPSTNHSETSNEAATTSISGSDVAENESSLSISSTQQLDQDEDRDHQWVNLHKVTNDRLKAATSAYAVHIGDYNKREGGRERASDEPTL